MLRLSACPSTKLRLVPLPMLGRICAALTLFTTPALADTHIDNIKGMSVSREGAIDRFEGMVIDDDGRIVELLDFGDRPTREIAYYVDGEGRVVTPGFVDAHVHVMDTGLGTLTLDMSQTRSLEEALSRLAAYAAAHPERPWLLGFGWDEERWGLGRLPSAADLDAVVGDRPVWLTRVDGHSGWGNALALEAGGISAESRDPAGGKIERLPGSRAPSGVLRDAAMASVEAAIPPPLPEDRDLALHNAQALFLANGVTAVTDMGTSIEDWMAMRRAGDAGRLQMRIISYAETVDTMLLIGGPAPTQWLYDDRLRLNGVTLQLDGTLSSRSAWLKAPYADAPEERGLIYTTGTQLRNLMSRAALDNFQVAIQASGDGAAAEALSAIEELAGDYGGDRRWRIENLQVIDPQDVGRLGQHGIIASMQPDGQPTLRTLLAQPRLGPERQAWFAPWGAVRAAGGTLAFGGDARAARRTPLLGLAAAIVDSDSREHSVSREQALAAYTAGAAYAGFAEGRFGALAVGERADFVMLSADPLASSPTALRGIRVLETWIAGQRVYQAPE